MDRALKWWETNSTLFFTGCAVIAFAFLPFFILGKDSFILIHDNLDSEFIYLHMMKLSHTLLGFQGSEEVPNVFNGIPRSYFHSEYNIVRLFFEFLPSFWAYVANSFVVRIIGFSGMFLLTKDYFIATRKWEKAAVFLTCLAFAFLPVYSLYGLTVLGQPLLLWAFLNLIHKKKLAASFLIVALVPFYSHFAFLAPFVLIALSAWGIFRQIKSRQFEPYFWIAVFLLFICFVLSEISMISNFISQDEITHRSKWIPLPSDPSWFIKRTLRSFFFGQYHSSFLIGPAILLLAIVSWVSSKKEVNKTIFILVLLIAGIALFNGSYRFIRYELKEEIHFLTSFKMDRFTVFIPMLYFLTLLLLISKAQLKKQLVIPVVVLFTMLTVASNKEVRLNFLNLINEKLTEKPTFEEFYAEDLFEEISKTIDRPKGDYRVISIGLHPSIAQYNGFYTLDGYLNAYPLKYKSSFRKIIEGELSEDQEIRRYFDHWGSRCYVFSEELWETCYINCYEGCDEEIDDLDLNIEQLKLMGAEYIFSAVPILNFEELDISFVQSFENSQSDWKIYLYAL